MVWRSLTRRVGREGWLDWEVNRRGNALGGTSDGSVRRYVDHRWSGPPSSAVSVNKTGGGGGGVVGKGRRIGAVEEDGSEEKK